MRSDRRDPGALRADASRRRADGEGAAAHLPRLPRRERPVAKCPKCPRSARQQAFYVTVQLLMFRDRMRVVDPMNEMAKGLSDDDLQSFADIISKLPPPQPAAGRGRRGAHGRAPRAGRSRTAATSATPPNFAGQDNVPRIANQREDYLLKALRGYKDNSRRGYDASMSDVIAADHRRADAGSRLLHRAGEVNIAPLHAVGLMVRSTRSVRLEPWRLPASFEMRPADAPQDEGQIIKCV